MRLPFGTVLLKPNLRQAPQLSALVISHCSNVSSLSHLRVQEENKNANNFTIKTPIVDYYAALKERQKILSIEDAETSSF